MAAAAAGVGAVGTWQLGVTFGIPTASRCARVNRIRCNFAVQHLRILATSVSSDEQFAGELERAKWAGDDPLARLVSTIISIKPLYRMIAAGARKYMISNAEKNGIPWKAMVKHMWGSEVFEEKERLENKFLSYPDYYLKQFHSYADGNLSWQAAFEVEPATLVIAQRTWPESASVEKAANLFQDAWVQAVEKHHRTFSDHIPMNILDIGCSVGIGTRFLAEKFPAANVTGLDLSPYFLAVAQYVDKGLTANGSATRKPIQWIHANGEDTGLPSSSLDIISFAYVLHECPQHATRNLLKEAHRLLKPGGTIVITDQSPRSKVIQVSYTPFDKYTTKGNPLDLKGVRYLSLPPAVFTMMKSTEPWMDEFYMLNMKNSLQEAGFSNINSSFTDPRHDTYTATAM